MGYSIQEIVSCYQKRIGTYDKQQWEKTVEQRILSGFTHVPKKTAKLKTELIDVDLVRGSSFTKAKPKHGLVAVARLAFCRLLFLPKHARWWSQQTSPALFALILSLYILQVGNLALYTYVTQQLPEDANENITGSEVVVPGVMMFFLCVLHSQIVSPHTSSKEPANKNLSKSRRVKRFKRRTRNPLLSDSKSSPDTASEKPVESTVKFSKRARIRKFSFEDGKNTVRQRRSSTIAQELVVQTQVEGETRQYDDGFESLNGNGSSDQSETAGVEPVETETKKEDGDTTPEAVFRNNWLQDSARRASVPHCQLSSGETDHNESDSEGSMIVHRQGRLIMRRRGSTHSLSLKFPGEAPGESSYNSSDDGSLGLTPLTEGCSTSAAEWIGITTNSDDCSVSSDLDDVAPHLELNDHPFASEFLLDKTVFQSPSMILSPSCAASDKVSCTMWENREVKKAELSVLDISSAIIARVEAMPENLDYFYGGMLVSVLLGLVPSLYRLMEVSFPPLTEPPTVSVTLGPSTSINLVLSYAVSYVSAFVSCAFGTNVWERTIAITALLERTILSGLFFFLIAVAERTFKQRFLYAKFFSHLTSFRRARKSELPHFRLNKVRNIKTWLSVRSYLKKRGPQHSVDVIVSSVFLVTLLLLSFLSVELLKDSERLHSIYNIEALVWCIILGLFLLRFMTLGTKINRKYRSLSVLITEQINLYLQIERKPKKKEELMVANSVLKLAADLLKELECPYKISGPCANPYLYTITKVVLLSALSGVLSEILGFKLKLHKIKIK